MIEDELRALEERIAARSEIAPLLADDFAEIGASGRRYDRADVLAASLSPPYLIEDFAARVLADDCALVTFRARGAWRSSIWVRRGGAWQLVFHQGTRCE